MISEGVSFMISSLRTDVTDKVPIMGASPPMQLTPAAPHLGIHKNNE